MGSAKSPERRADGRTMVEDDQGRRPFMRGIMIHSLLSRGASFEAAFRTASAVRDKLRGQSVVSRRELAQAVEDQLGGSDSLEPKRAVVLPPGMFVIGGDSRARFSKGFLSQSLLAAAIEPNEAFDVALEIERQLVDDGVTEIERRDLRRIACETLDRRFGPRVAVRYLVWRHFNDPEKPVILLLGGAAGVGKSALAQEVAHRLGLPRVVSTDAIRQVMRIMLSPELMPAIHASSYDAHRVVGGLEHSEDPVIEAFRMQAATVSVGVRAIIDRAVSENTSMILDGVAILPGLIDPAVHEGLAHVIFLVVAALDEKAFRSRFSSRAKDAGRRPPHRYLENLDSIQRIQDHVLELAEAQDVPIVDNEDFDSSVLSIVRHVTETLRKKDEFDVRELL